MTVMVDMVYVQVVITTLQGLLIAFYTSSYVHSIANNIIQFCNSTVKLTAYIYPYIIQVLYMYLITQFLCTHKRQEELSVGIMYTSCSSGICGVPGQ